MKYERGTNREQNEEEKENAVRAGEYAARMRAAMSDGTYALPEASLRLPFDDVLFERSRQLAIKLAGQKLAYILVIGIGGSNLGSKAVYEASAGVFDAYTSFAPKIIFADTCAPELLADIADILLENVDRPEELVIVVASKSGTTTETIMNAAILIPALEVKFGSLASRTVCITDEGSPLWKTGTSGGFHLLPVPHNVGGRYSVFSPLSVFPLLCAGVDMKAMVSGAQAVVHDSLRGADSDAYRAAEDIFAWQKQGISVFDLFLFHPELESAGKWYRQLFAESLGKQTEIDGTLAEHRMIPTFSIGSTDLHSVEQLHLANPKFVARTLVRAHVLHWEHQFLAHDTVFAPLVPGIMRRAPCEVMDAIYHGVKETYRARGVSFGEVVLADLEPESIGAFLQFQMCMVMHLGNLLRINAFDQPDVEAYKEVVRHILEPIHHIPSS
jgi:glucose-6-phosphate isomerase